MPATARSACFLFGFAAFVAAQQSQAPPYAGVSGVVLNDATGAPVPRALVTLSTTDAAPSDATTYTDARGAFAFSFIPPGRYRLEAGCSGCLKGWYGAATPKHPPATLALEAGDERRGIEIRVQPLGAISGIVLDPDGDPLPGASVQLFVRGYSRRKPSLDQIRTALTDDRGEYRLFHVPQGACIVVAGHPAQTAPARFGGVDGQGIEMTRYGVQFYSNADRLSAATPVTLPPGKELSGIDFQLPLRETVRLKGKVTAPPNLPPDAAIPVEAVAQDVLGPPMFGAEEARPPDYTFDIGSLVPGTYLVSARVAVDGREYIGAERVEAARDSGPVTIRLDPGIELTGRVELQGESAGPAPHFLVRLSPGDQIASLGGVRPADVQPDGTFRIPNVTPGIWDVGVEPIPGGGYIKSMRLGAQDVLTEDMVIGPDTTAPLNIVVSTRGAIVEGTVLEDGEGTKPARAAVLLAPDGKFEEVESFYSTAIADDAGHFEIKGIRPGRYRLFAFEQMEPEYVLKPAALKPFREKGELLDVSEGARVSRQLRRISAAPRPKREGKR